MLLEINFTLVLFAITFLVFIYLLNLTLFKPVGKIIEKRKNLIDGDYSKAKEFTQKANEMLESYKREIKSARLSAQNIIQEAILQAQKQKQEKILVLMENLTKEKEAALKQLTEEKKEAMKKLEEKLNVLTELITNKIIGSGEKTLIGLH